MALLILPLYFNIRIITIGNKLSNNIIDGVAREENCALSRSDRFRADETLLFYYKVFVYALGAETVTTHGGLTFVDEVEAEWAD